MNSMKGKIVLITGSSSGIGKQTTIELAAQGATVLLHAPTADEGLPVLEQVRKNIPSASFDLFVADFEKQYQVQKMASEINAVYSRLDVLINSMTPVTGCW
jgi:retinol dehydrogenase-12